MYGCNDHEFDSNISSFLFVCQSLDANFADALEVLNKNWNSISEKEQFELKATQMQIAEGDVKSISKCPKGIDQRLWKNWIILKGHKKPNVLKDYIMWRAEALFGFKK